MGNTYSHSYTEIIEDINSIFYPNHSEDNEKPIIEEFNKLEKTERLMDGFHGPYTPYVESEVKNYCISFTYYYPKDCLEFLNIQEKDNFIIHFNENKLFPLYDYFVLKQKSNTNNKKIFEINEIKNVKKSDKKKHFIHLLNSLILKNDISQEIEKNTLNKIYKKTIEVNRKYFYILSSKILKYYHKKPRISCGFENLKEENGFIECKVNLCFFSCKNVYNFLVYLSKNFFPSRCFNQTTRIVKHIENISNNICKTKLKEKIVQEYLINMGI